jgi:hypothetical protein
MKQTELLDICNELTKISLELKEIAKSKSSKAIYSLAQKIQDQTTKITDDIDQ